MTVAYVNSQNNQREIFDFILIYCDRRIYMISDGYYELNDKTNRWEIIAPPLKLYIKQFHTSWVDLQLGECRCELWYSKEFSRLMYPSMRSRHIQLIEAQNGF